MIRTAPTAGHNSEPDYRAINDAVSELDEQIASLQEAKRDIYSKVREEFGKKVAEQLKLAIKLAAMPADKRTDRDEVEEGAFRILALLQSPRAPRATRAREIIEEFDAETGEITEVSNPQPASSPVTEKAGEASPPVSPATPLACPQSMAVPGGEPSIPSSDDDGAKMEEHASAVPGQSGVAPGIHSVKSEQAATNPESFEPPAFLTKPPRDPVNERCEKPLTCKYGRHPQKLTCSTCKTAWEIAKRRAQAA